jgi:hypothetical protein
MLRSWFYWLAHLWSPKLRCAFLWSCLWKLYIWSLALLIFNSRLICVISGRLKIEILSAFQAALRLPPHAQRTIFEAIWLIKSFIIYHLMIARDIIATVITQRRCGIFELILQLLSLVEVRRNPHCGRKLAARFLLSDKCLAHHCLILYLFSCTSCCSILKMLRINYEVVLIVYGRSSFTPTQGMASAHIIQGFIQSLLGVHKISWRLVLLLSFINEVFSVAVAGWAGWKLVLNKLLQSHVQEIFSVLKSTRALLGSDITV